MTQRELGLVNQVFSEQSLARSPGRARDRPRPLLDDRLQRLGERPARPSLDRRELALAHNGNLINAVELHAGCARRGSFRSTSDSEIIAALLSTHEAEQLEDAIADVLPRLRGAFSTVVMTRDGVVAFRDPAGLRPLCLGMLGDRYCVASESCALDIIGAKLMREVEPGEMVVLTEKGIDSREVAKSPRRAFCVFEHIYFARPDSILEGNRTQVSRRKMGEILWREAPVNADVVIPVPDSGNPGAAGYSKASGIPQDDGLIKNRYVARTFIQPGQELRKHGLRLKFNPMPEVVAASAGRRGRLDRPRQHHAPDRRRCCATRARRGAHADLAPPIRHPCHYGIDMSTREEMVAHGRTVEEIARELGCDSLAYLSLEGVYEAIRSTRETHCDACFTGEYPLDGTDGAPTASSPWRTSCRWSRT
jgi:amidophosphoribosyltransferase